MSESIENKPKRTRRKNPELEKKRLQERREARELLKKVEIKRVAERLTKKELCILYKWNYNFYMNCISDRNPPSKVMIEHFGQYLNTETLDIYRMVFASREEEAEYHELLDISDEESDALIELLKEKDILTEPQV